MIYISKGGRSRFLLGTVAILLLLLGPANTLSLKPSAKRHAVGVDEELRQAIELWQHLLNVLRLCRNLKCSSDRLENARGVIEVTVKIQKARRVGL